MKQQPTNTTTKTQDVAPDTTATQDTVVAPDTSKDVVKTEEQTQKEPIGEMLPVKVSPVDPVTTTPVISEPMVITTTQPVITTDITTVTAPITTPAVITTVATTANDVVPSTPTQL